MPVADFYCIECKEEFELKRYCEKNGIKIHIYSPKEFDIFEMFAGFKPLTKLFINERPE